MSLNRAQIIGNLTRDPELRTTTGGTPVCSFGVATNRVYTDRNGQKQDETEYHNIVAWARLAEICNQYLGKGRKVFVEGRLQTREWEGQDGVKRRTTEIVAENMIMLSSAPGGSASFSGGGATAQARPQRSAAEPNTGGAPAAGAENIPTISYDMDPTQPGVSQDEVDVEGIPF